MKCGSCVGPCLTGAASGICRDHGYGAAGTGRQLLAQVCVTELLQAQLLCKLLGMALRTRQKVFS